MDTACTTTLPALADRSRRYDGWTPDRQRSFLESIAEGHTVASACALVGMAQSSAYALRRRAAGAGFALGWRAATLLAREKVADTLLARAIDGQVETITRADGETVTRHRYDNRLASTMLARLDRFADREAGEATHQAARLVAAEFDSFLDLIDRDEGPARTGVFLAARIAGDEMDPDLGAVLSLARADRWLRTGRGAASEIDVADLDPDARDHWTAEQWQRAHASGMLAFAAPAEPLRHSPLSPLHPDDEAETDDAPPVWWDDIEREWRTRFAPPHDFDGDEDGHYGDEDYSRTLTLDEEDAIEAHNRIERAQLHAAAAPERDAWFAGLSRRAAPEKPATPAPAPADAPVASGSPSPTVAGAARLPADPAPPHAADPTATPLAATAPMVDAPHAAAADGTATPLPASTRDAAQGYRPDTPDAPRPPAPTDTSSLDASDSFTAANTRAVSLARRADDAAAYSRKLATPALSPSFADPAARPAAIAPAPLSGDTRSGNACARVSFL